MMRPVRAVWGTWWGAKYETGSSEGAEVATESYDLCKTYGYDVRASRTRFTRAER